MEHYATEAIKSPGGTTVHYIVQPEGSRFTVRAFATGLLSSFGHNPTISVPDFEGEIRLCPDAFEQSSLRLTFHSGSLVAINDLSKKDLEDINRRMREEVLETDSYPDIVYECSKLSASKTGEGQYWASLDGDLTLHGVERKQAVSVRVAVAGDLLKATGDFSVRLSDYEIRPVSAVGGTIKIKDELKLSFDISARKQ